MKWENWILSFWKNTKTNKNNLCEILGCLKRLVQGISLVVQWLGLRLSVQGVQVRSLVREVRSHMLLSQGTEAKNNNDNNENFKSWCKEMSSMWQMWRNNLSLRFISCSSAVCFILSSGPAYHVAQKNKRPVWKIRKYPRLLLYGIFSSYPWGPSSWLSWDTEHAWYDVHTSQVYKNLSSIAHTFSK